MQTNPQIALAWLALVAWTALIAGLSGGDFSHHETSRFLVPFLRWIWPGISSASLELAQVAVRKGAHLAEYAVLAGLAVRAVWVSFSLTLPRAAAVSGIWVVAVAFADELHQAGLAERTGSPWDMGLDVAAGAAALAVVLGLAGLRREGPERDRGPS